MSSCNTSVVSVNYLISQNPKIATTLFPGIIGSTSPLCSILSDIIFTPASPNPRANNAPTLTIVYSSIRVSFLEPVSASSAFLESEQSHIPIHFYAIATFLAFSSSFSF